MQNEKINSISLVCSKRYSNNKYNNIVNKIKEYIDENYQDPNLSVELIADCVQLSTNYVRSIFKVKLGISISDYLIQLRFLKARQMLHDTDYKVKEIGTMVGFNDEKYIYINFKKYFGITGTEYRKSLVRKKDKH